MKPSSPYAGLSRLINTLGDKPGALDATTLALKAFSAPPDALPALRQKALDAGFPGVVFARLAFDANRPEWMANWGSTPSPWFDDEEKGGGPTLLYDVLDSASNDWVKVAFASGLSPTARLPVFGAQGWQYFEDMAHIWKKTRPEGFDGVVSLLEYGVAQNHSRLTTLLTGEKEVQEDKAAWNRACMMLGGMVNILPENIQATLLSGFDPFYQVRVEALFPEDELFESALHVWMTHDFPESKNTTLFAWLHALPVDVLEKLCGEKSPWEVWPPGETHAHERYALLDSWAHRLAPQPPLSNRAFALLEDIQEHLGGTPSPEARSRIITAMERRGKDSFDTIFGRYSQEEDGEGNGYWEEEEENGYSEEEEGNDDEEDADDLPWQQWAHFINTPRPGEPVIEWPVWEKTVSNLFSWLEKNRNVTLRAPGLAFLEKVCDPGWVAQLSLEGQLLWEPLRPVFATVVDSLALQDGGYSFRDPEPTGGIDTWASLSLALHALHNPALPAKKGLRL
jgi:hypothetical protein